MPVFDENGNIIKKIGIISDITKTKELEEKYERWEYLSERAD